MKTTKTLILTLGLAAMFTACDSNKDENPSGSWTSAAPVSVTQGVAEAKSASKTMTFDFTATDSKTAGDVVVTADYDVTSPVVTDSVTTDATYKVTASIKGTWTQEKGEDDDYLLSFDTNTLSVSGTDAPELGPVTDEFLTSLTTFTSIEDVEVSKDGTHMTFETKHPEVKYHFVKK